MPLLSSSSKSWSARAGLVLLLLKLSWNPHFQDELSKKEDGFDSKITENGRFRVQKIGSLDDAVDDDNNYS